MGFVLPLNFLVFVQVPSQVRGVRLEMRLVSDTEVSGI